MPEQICENCQKANPEDATYCYACGHILPNGLKMLSTHSLQDSQSLQPQIRWGTAYFGDYSLLRIRVRHTGELIETRFDVDCVLGRAAGDVKPDIDLTPYGGVDMGVSRQHVKLTRQSATIMVQDLGSVNGTFLNGEKLIPHQQRVLRNEDELCLGQMMLRISFTRLPTPPLPPKPETPLPPKPETRLPPTPETPSPSTPETPSPPTPETPSPPTPESTPPSEPSS